MFQKSQVFFIESISICTVFHVEMINIKINKCIEDKRATDRNKKANENVLKNLSCLLFCAWFQKIEIKVKY